MNLLGAQEMGESPTSPNSLVGHAVRFDDSTTPFTRIKFVTDGLLIRETLSDPLLSKYSIVMVDEAHERGLDSDVLLGLLKKIRRKRPELRIIICSATIDAESFLDFFVRDEVKICQTQERVAKKSRWGEVGSDSNSNSSTPPLGEIISIDGRQFPVEIMHLKEPVSNYVLEAAKTAVQIHDSEPPGDILVFLPTSQNIDEAIRIADEMIRDTKAKSQSKTTKSKSNSKFTAHLLPLFAALPLSAQTKAFAPSPPSTRKIIFR